MDTVSVVVRYYAGARAAAGVTEETLRLAGGSTVADALSVAETSRGPELTKVLSACSFLLDGVALHERATPLADGMQLDVLPPFAGG